MGLLELKARFDILIKDPAVQKLKPMQLAKYNDAKGRFEAAYKNGQGKEDQCVEALQNLETVISRIASTGGPTSTTATTGATSISSPPPRSTAVVEEAVEETLVVLTPERVAWVRAMNDGAPVSAATTSTVLPTDSTMKPPTDRKTGGSASGGSSRRGSVSGGSASSTTKRPVTEEPEEEKDEEDDALFEQAMAIAKIAAPMVKTLGNPPALLKVIKESIEKRDVVRLKDLVAQMKRKLGLPEGETGAETKADEEAATRRAEEEAAAAKRAEEAEIARRAEEAEAARRAEEAAAAKKAEEEAARKAEEEAAAKKAEEEEAALTADLTKYLKEVKALFQATPELENEDVLKRVKKAVADKSPEALVKIVKELKALKAELEAGATRQDSERKARLEEAERMGAVGKAGREEAAAQKAAEEKALKAELMRLVEEAKLLLVQLPKPDRAPFVEKIKKAGEDKDAVEMGGIVQNLKTAVEEAAAAKRAEEERLAEAARVEEERRVEAERRAEEERIAEAARVEAARRAEEERVAEAARVEAARIAAEQEAARVEAARVEAERIAAEEAARVEAERIAAEEAARLEAERVAAEEAARVEAERVAAEEAAREEAARIAAAEEAARVEAARVIASSPEVTTKIAKLNLSETDKALLETVKARPVISAGATKALAGIGGMITDAELKAEQTRADARATIRSAETKSAKADEDLLKAAPGVAVANEAVAQADAGMRAATSDVQEAADMAAAVIQKKFDAYVKAMKQYAQDCVNADYDSATITKNFNAFWNKGLDKMPHDPKGAFAELKKGWDHFAHYTGVTATAPALKNQADADEIVDKAAADAKKTEADEKMRVAKVAKEQADTLKSTADGVASEAQSRKDAADREKTGATDSLNNAGQIVVEAEAKAKVAAARLTAALRYGPASKTTVAPTAVTGLSGDQLAERQRQAASRDKATAAVLENFKDHPDVADAALEAIQGSDHPEAFEGGVGQLCTIATGNFKGQATAAEARTMAKNALKMAGAVGGDYLARMDAYYATDAAKQPDTLRDPDHKKSALNYTGAMGGALLADDGSVKADTAAFEAVRANLSFHPGSLKAPLTNLVQHVEKFREKVSDDEITATMQGITLQPQGGSKGLVQKTLGLPPSAAVNVKDARKAVLSAALTPLTQGPVGSCFATCNCMDYQEKNPAGFLADLGEMVKTGTLTKGGETLPVVKNIPADENGLLRGLEYTVASLGGQAAQSTRKKDVERKVDNGFIMVDAEPEYRKLNTAKTRAQRQLADARTERSTALAEENDAIDEYNAAIVAKDTAYGEYDTEFKANSRSTATANKLAIYNTKVADMTAKEVIMNDKAAVTIDKQAQVAVAETRVAAAEAAWPAKSEAMKVAAAAAITWEYDSEMAHATVTVAADGSSSKGGWVMKNASDNSVITNDTELQACLKDAFKGVLGAGVPDSDIEDVLALPAFMTQVKEAPSGGGNVFRDEGGGQEADSKAVLTGKENEKQSMIGATGGTVNERAKGLLASVADNLKDTPEDTVTVGVSGVHSERALPRHPSLDALKSGPGDVATKINAVFTETAAKATTPMDEDHMKHLFAKSGSTFLKDYMGDDAEALVSGNTAPTGALKPKELRDKIYNAVKARVEAMFTPSATALKNVAAKIDAFILNELFPQFVVADTNWGDATGKVFHVIAPDLETGEPKLYKKDERSGQMESADNKYVNANWDACLDKPPVVPTTA